MTSARLYTVKLIRKSLKYGISEKERRPNFLPKRGQNNELCKNYDWYAQSAWLLPINEKQLFVKMLTGIYYRSQKHTSVGNAKISPRTAFPIPSRYWQAIRHLDQIA